MFSKLKKFYNNYKLNKEKLKLEKALNRDYEFYRCGSEPYLYYRSNFDRPGFTLVLVNSLGAMKFFGGKQNFQHKVNDLWQVKVKVETFVRPKEMSLKEAIDKLKQRFIFDLN